MNKFAIISVCLFSAVPMLATAQQTTQTQMDRGTAHSGYGPVTGDRELSLSGLGSMSGDFDNLRFSGQADFGWYLQEQLLLGVRQGLNYTSIPDEGISNDLWNGATRGYVNWVFNLDAWRPFVGANLGYRYGDGVTDSFFAGLEAGSKFYVQDRTFIFGRGEYLWAFEDADDIETDGIDLTAGIGYNF